MKPTPEFVEGEVIPNAHNMVMDYLTEIFQGDTPPIVRHAIARELAPELFGPMPFVAVVLEGGLVQAVVTDQPAMQGIGVLIIDYDDEGADLDELTIVPQEDGGESDAVVSYDIVQAATIDLEAVRDNIRKKEEKLN